MIPVNEAFDKSAADKSCGCPLCLLHNMLEANEIDTILGSSSFMEPDVRIKTNRQGFCRAHFDMLLGSGKNKLGVALMLESHLIELEAGLGFGSDGKRSASEIEKLEGSCYICYRTEDNFSHMIDTAVLLWQKNDGFPEKLKEQPYFCLPHYKLLLKCAQKKLNKKQLSAFVKDCEGVQRKYLEKLQGDISWFCKKYDYRYKNEPWNDAKDSVERTVNFLNSDIHKEEDKK